MIYPADVGALLNRHTAQIQDRAGVALIGTGACFVSLVLGWKIGHDETRLPIALMALIVVALVGARAFGVAVGLLVLAALNGLPFVDLEEYTQSGSFRVSDVALVGLLGALALRNATLVAKPELEPWLRRARWWGLAIGTWWILTVLRSSFFDSIPLLKAALFGRDFVYFAALVPLLIGGLRSRREIVELLGTLTAATVLFAVAHVAVVVTGASAASWFVHESLSNDIGGVTRVYALMGDAVVAATPFGIALALMGPSRRLRLAGAALAVVCSASVLLQFARATYFGLFFGLICAAAVWLAGTAQGAVARRLAVVFAGLALAGGAVAVSASRTNTTESTYAGASALPTGGLPAPAVIGSRLSSGVSDISSNTGTFAYRYKLDKKMLSVLGHEWLVGLGFWHPDVKYVPNLPDGSIRNADTGFMNSLMTMGAVGTALIYLPLLALLGAIMTRLRLMKLRPNEGWFFFGTFTLVVALLIGSLSLVSLFSVSGLALTSVLIGCAIRLIADPEPERHG